METVKGIKLVTLDESRELFSSSSDEAREYQEISNKIVDLIDELVRERESRGLSQRDFADILDWKQPALARFERLDVIPRLDTFLKVSRKLGGNLYLEFFEDNRIPVECMKSAKYVNELPAFNSGTYNTNSYEIKTGGQQWINNQVLQPHS